MMIVVKYEMRVEGKNGTKKLKPPGKTNLQLANIAHDKYPAEVSEQFNLTQLWIDPTFFDTETMQLNEIGDVIPGIEVGKIYMNVADGKMYKLGPNKIFEVVSLTDLQD